MTSAILAFLVAVNPAASARAFTRDRRPDRPVAIAIGAAIAVAILVALAAASETLLDALDLSAGTFRLGAGVVVAVTGLRWLVLGPSEGVAEPDSGRALSGFVAFPTLLTPGAAVLAVTVRLSDGLGTAVVGASVGAAAGAAALLWRRRVPVVIGAALVRIIGAAAVVIGIGIGVDGVQTM